MSRFMDWVLGRSRDMAGGPPTARSTSPQQWSASKLRFVCEQDGDPERVLKEEVASLLLSRPSVARAYLARVDYGDAAAYEVALCISGPTDEALVSEVSSIVASQSPQGAHLDIMFLSATQEAELQSVCKPFYEAG